MTSRRPPGCAKTLPIGPGRVLSAFARMVNPIAPAVRAAGYGGYYWVLDQAEIATDVMFNTRRDLLDIWPDWSITPR
jgi:hypothetical protein